MTTLHAGICRCHLPCHVHLRGEGLPLVVLIKQARADPGFGAIVLRLRVMQLCTLHSECFFRRIQRDRADGRLRALPSDLHQSQTPCGHYQKMCAAVSASATWNRKKKFSDRLGTCNDSVCRRCSQRLPQRGWEQGRVEQLELSQTAQVPARHDTELCICQSFGGSHSYSCRRQSGMPGPMCWGMALSLAFGDV